MCGIAGIFDLTGQRPINQDHLIRMRDSLIHRGPDEAGIHSEDGVALSHRRLSIIDLSSGQQPLFNHDKSVVIIFNGEIYNFQALTVELKALGYHFQTHSDTETIVHAWEAWGEDCVNHLRGMFAFAIWDRNQHTLFIARDRLGEKPLFYTITSDGLFLFASELKALLTYPGIQRTINPQSIECYFALGYIAEPDTIYQNIHKLPAGHTLTHHPHKQGSPKQYWDLPFTPNPGISEADAQAELVERLREAVKIRMVSEVPLGAFLSGGVDSSAVVAMMATSQSEPVNTCSIGFNEANYDESDYANQIAARYKTNHFQKTVDTDDFGLIDTLSGLYDEPYADSSAIPTYRVCQLAKQRVTVALSGDGADELMSGYRRHQWHMHEEELRSRLPLSIRRPLFGLLGSVYPKADWAPQFLRAKSTFQALAMDSVEGYFHSVSQIPNHIRSQLFSDQLNSELGGYQAIELFRRHAKNAPDQHPLSMIQYLDIKTYLIDDILTKVDRASMAHSLEVRVPILDHQLVEWLSGLPPQYKLSGRTGKKILKKAMEPYVPNDILYRKKMGFSIPLAEWFKGPLRQQVQESLTGEQLLSTGWFNPDFLHKIVREHQSGQSNHSTMIWSLLMFERFLHHNQ